MKIKLLAILLVLCLVFSSCGAKVEQESTDNTSMFVVVETTDYWKIVYHKETKIMYAVSYNAYNRGNFTVLVNANGTPMIWEE